jgi:hypothetical protein
MLCRRSAVSTKCCVDEMFCRRSAVSTKCCVDEVFCRRSAVSTKCSVDEMLCRRNALSTKCCVDEIFCRRNVLSTKSFRRNALQRSVVSTKCCVDKNFSTKICRPTAFRQNFVDQLPFDKILSTNNIFTVSFSIRYIDLNVASLHRYSSFLTEQR